MRQLRLIDADQLPTRGVFGHDLALSDYRKWLGSSQPDLFYDARGGLFANAFAALAGTITDGHHLFLHLPQYYPDGDPDHARLADFGCDFHHFPAHFNDRLRRLLAPNTQTFAPRITHDSAEVDFHCPRSAFLGGRGRGKSTRLAEKIQWLYTKNTAPILVVAPFARNHEALAQLPEIIQKTLIFLPPDEACRQLPSAAHLIVDEAAALPPAQLRTLCDHYPNLTLATTLEGYEGSANTFRLKTLPQLAIPETAIFQLTTAHRFAADDPLETAIKRIFLLADLPALPLSAEPGAVQIFSLPPKELTHNEPLLQRIWQLLRSAHYRTRPEDLKRLLDLPGQTLWLAECDGQIVGVLHLLEEAPLDEELAQAIIAGKRRPRGRLLMQQLLIHTASAEWANTPLFRIQRIAVAETHRRQGIASALIQAVKQHTRAPLGTSFSHSSELAIFWQHNGFQKIYQAPATRSRHHGPTCVYLSF